MYGGAAASEAVTKLSIALIDHKRSLSPYGASQRVEARRHTAMLITVDTECPEESHHPSRKRKRVQVRLQLIRAEYLSDEWASCPAATHVA
jgi:hypothetical protein